MKRFRDMPRRQFNDVLKQRGWRKVLLWIEVCEGHSIGMVMINGKVNLRASVAYAARRLKEIEAKAETAR